MNAKILNKLRNKNKELIKSLNPSGYFSIYNNKGGSPESYKRKIDRSPSSFKKGRSPYDNSPSLNLSESVQNTEQGFLHSSEFSIEPRLMHPLSNDKE